jgi:hypothetical protein
MSIGPTDGARLDKIRSDLILRTIKTCRWVKVKRYTRLTQVPTYLSG